MTNHPDHQFTGQRRVLAVHDICGVGKCSLTTAVPILSAAGIEACVMPTAVFSTHTAFSSFACEDLTKFLLPMAEALKKENFHFDAVYTGYLANGAQAEIVSDVITMLADADTRIIVDPAMADGGKLYACLPPTFPAEMEKLCRRASVITPNVTEALLLLGRDGTALPTSKAEYEELILALSERIGTDVVLTSVMLEEGAIDCAVAEGGRVSFVSEPYVAHGYHGTGDVFSSVLCAALLRGRSLYEATGIAAEFVRRTIRNTAKNNPALWYGVNFEGELASLSALLSD
ncbi:MAG: pyridoxamine kinase [Clostridia bacterium]|nr:pyridoxamine kinase [Clostridia bacterium]